MTVYTKVRARYTKGTLKLLQTLELPEGMEVRLDVTTPTGSKKPRRPGKRRFRYPIRTLPWRNLRRLSGIVALGGNRLTDSEALYD